MKKVGCLIFLSAGVAHAASWVTLPSASWLKIYYSKPEGEFNPHRGFMLEDGAAGETVITTASFFVVKENVSILSCGTYRYTGELQETFTFQYKDGVVSRLSKDVVENLTIDSINEQKEAEMKMVTALTSCSQFVKDPITIYVPSRFGELYLAGLSNAKVKLSRVIGVSIHPEFNP